MHTHPMPESAGEFQKPDERRFNCRACGGIETVIATPWESSCGGYEDYKMRCTKCDKTWWEEGADA